MSYYYNLTKEQIQERKLAFDSAYLYNENQYVIKNNMPSREQLNLIADYIGYLIYRSNRKQKKYQEKEISLLNYVNYYRLASEALVGLIHSTGMEKIKEINPLSYRMMERFIRMDDGL
jgi:phosphatidate phosphatase PAH1